MPDSLVLDGVALSAEWIAEQAYRQGLRDGRKAKVRYEIPDWIDPEAFLDYKEMRRLKKSPITDGVDKRLVGSLRKFREQGYDPDKLLNLATDCSWKGIFLPKENIQDFMLKTKEPKRKARLEVKNKTGANLILVWSEGRYRDKDGKAYSMSASREHGNVWFMDEGEF